MQYDFTLVANGGQAMDVKGRFVKYRSGVGAIRVKFTSGGYVDLLPGQGVWNIEFNGLTIQDRSGNNNYGSLLAGDFDFRDERISGDVSVIDGGKNRTLANLSFISNADAANPPAGSYAYTGLFNPAGSGRVAIVENVYVASQSGACVFSLGIAGTAAPFTTMVGYGVSKKSGGIASIMESRRIISADTTPINTTGSKQLIVQTVTQNANAVIAFKEPVVVLPGYGFYVWNATVAMDTRASIEYYEDAL